MNYTIYEKDGVFCSIPDSEDISLNNILISHGFVPTSDRQIIACENKEELNEFLAYFYGEY